jgi:hypothetical protein
VQTGATRTARTALEFGFVLRRVRGFPDGTCQLQTRLFALAAADSHGGSLEALANEEDVMLSRLTRSSTEQSALTITAALPTGKNMKERATRIAAVVFTLAWSTACAKDVEHVDSRVVRTDSMQVEVITHLGDESSLPVDSLSGDPVLAIHSGASGNVIFHQITDVTPLGDGTIAIAAHGSRAVYLFDEAGSFKMSLGGDGDGPGEFRGVWGTSALAGDSLVVFDSRLGRLTIFNPAGQVSRTLDISRFLPPARGADVHALDSGFALVGLASVGMRRTAGAYRDSAASYLLDANGDSVGFYGEFPGSEVSHAQRLFGARPFGARLFSGSRGDRLIIGNSSEAEMREFGTTGQLVRVIRWPDHDRHVTEARAAEYIQFRLQSVPENERAQFGADLRELSYSQAAPAYHGLVVSSAGTIWLGDYPGPEALSPQPALRPRMWTVFGRDGVRRRLIQSPPGFELKAVRNGLAYGVRTDDVGVQAVWVYRVPEI